MESHAARLLLSKKTAEMEKLYAGVKSLDLSACELYSLPAAVIAFLTHLEVCIFSFLPVTKYRVQPHTHTYIHTCTCTITAVHSKIVQFCEARVY
jgi:hypothetical protein